MEITLINGWHSTVPTMIPMIFWSTKFFNDVFTKPNCWSNSNIIHEFMDKLGSWRAVCDVTKDFFGNGQVALAFKWWSTPFRSVFSHVTLWVILQSSKIWFWVETDFLTRTQNPVETQSFMRIFCTFFDSALDSILLVSKVCNFQRTITSI